MATTFENYCNCGGYAWSMNGRSPLHPHMVWCAQYAEFNAWLDTPEGKAYLEEHADGKDY